MVLIMIRLSTIQRYSDYEEACSCYAWKREEISFLELSSTKTQPIEQTKHNTWTGVHEVFLRSSATDPRVQLIY